MVTGFYQEVQRHLDSELDSQLRRLSALLSAVVHTFTSRRRCIINQQRTQDARSISTGILYFSCILTPFTQLLPLKHIQPRLSSTSNTANFEPAFALPTLSSRQEPPADNIIFHEREHRWVAITADTKRQQLLNTLQGL